MDELRGRYNYYHLEFYFTVFMIIALLCLFWEVLSGYNLYLAFGLLAGFCFSGFAIKKISRINSFLKVIINICVLVIFASAVYFIINSSLFYRDVIFICIRALFVLEVILSFGAFLPSFLPYVQVLSIPLFMSYPVIIKEYGAFSVLLMSAYIITFFGVLRLKLYTLFESPKEIKARFHYSIFLSVIVLLISLSAARVFFPYLSIEKIKKGGILPEEDIEAEQGFEAVENEFYGLQEKIQERIARLIPQLKTTEDRYKVLALLNSLVNDSQVVLEVERTENGLISKIESPGPGLEKGESEELTINIKKHTDNKISLNLKKARKNIMDILKSNSFTLGERVSILSQISKMRRDNDPGQIQGYRRGLNKSIDKTSVNPEIKKKLKENVRSIEEWKNLELYRKKSEHLEKIIGSLPEENGQEVADLLSQVKKTESISDFKDLEAGAEMLGQEHPSEAGDAAGIIKGLIEAKLKMLLSQKSKELKDALENSPSSDYDLEGLKKEIGKIEDSESVQDFLNNVSSLIRMAQEGDLDAAKEIRDMLEIKMHLLIKKNKEEAAQLLKESTLSADSIKELLEAVGKLYSSNEIKNVIAQSKSLIDKLEKLSAQGFISEKNKNDLKGKVGDAKDIAMLKLNLDAGPQAQKGNEKDKNESQYQKEWELTIEEISLEEEKKEALRQLMEELLKAQALGQSEDIREAMEKEIDALIGNGGIKREEGDKLKDAIKKISELKRIFMIEKELFDAKKKLEDLRMINSQEAIRIDVFLERIRKSSSSKELKTQIDKLAKYLKTRKQEPNAKLKEMQGKNSWQIYILPFQLIIPFGSEASFKTIAIYNNIFIKELNSDLEWFSSNPAIAWIDQKGRLHALSKGNTKISASYKGISSQEAAVSVVDKVTDSLTMVLREELAK